MNIDRNLKFRRNILKQCRKTARKLSALTRIFKFKSLERRRVLMKSFIESQFVYCPLVWMCCDKTSDNRINHLHECALRTVYNENVSIFENVLEKENPVTTHVRNLGILATELYKIKENQAAPLMHEIFEQKNIQYNLRSQTDFQLGSAKTVNCGLRALRNLVLKMLNIVPFEIKSWKPTHCSCNLCQPYFHCLGYI